MPDYSGNLTLQVLVIAPLIGAIGLLLPTLKRDASIRAWTMISTLLTLVVSLVGAYHFNWAAPGMQMNEQALPWIDAFGLKFGFGVDGMSMWLILLTTCLMPLVVFGSWTAVSQRTKEFHVWLLLLQAAMLGTFVATDLIFFYICFEFTLIPLYFLIGVFGSTQRLKAARVFFLYTFTGSMLTFAGLLYVAWHAADVTGEWTFHIRTLVHHATHPVHGLTGQEQFWVLLAMLAGFAVKVPLFPVHTWLPLAHTEAPTAGSVILAGVLLKLGTYAMLRLAIPMTPDGVLALAPTVGILAVAGILYTALICWVQKDIKKLIAYSSVSHLGFCVLGMWALNAEGISGSIMYMINHGLSTGALFLCVGMIYERFHTREMRLMSGLGRAMPVWSFFMVFFCLASVGLPGLNGFVGEFLCLLGAFRADQVLGWEYAVAAGFGMIVAAIYILYMVGKVIMGPLKIPQTHHEDHADDDHHGPAVKDLNTREIITLAPLAIGCLVLGLYPAPVLDSLDPTIESVVAAFPEDIREVVYVERPEVASGTIEVHTIDASDVIDHYSETHEHDTPSDPDHAEHP